MNKYVAFIQQNIRYFLRIIVGFRDIFFYTPQTTTNQRKRNILIFNWRDTKHVYAGGAEVYIHELAKSWVKKGHTVTLFCGSDGKSKRNEAIDGVNIIRRGGFYFVYIWAMLYYLVNFRGKFDVLIDCENGIPFFTPLYSRIPKFLVIHHVHQEIFIKSLKPPFSTFASFLEGRFMPIVYRNVMPVTVSPSSKKDILKHKLTAIEPKLIYNGIDHSKYQPGIKSKVPLIVYIGRLQAYKSLHVFIKSAQIILQKVPNATFIIAGHGGERSRLAKLAKKYGINYAISFTGYVQEKEKIALFQKAWVFVNPSMREGWGITTIEANACGTPVIASDVPGLQDAVKHNQTGILVPYGDSTTFAAMTQKLITNKKLRFQMEKDALVWSNDFSWQKSADDFEKLLMDITTAPEPVVKKIPRLTYVVQKYLPIYFNMKPTVTIIIPVYNEEKNIRLLITQLLQQVKESYRLQEIIVTSDGSTDATVSILSELNHKYKKLKVIKGKIRKGKPRRINECFKRISSDIAVVLDGDITLTSRKTIEYLIKPMLDKPPAALTSGKSQYLKPDTFFEKVMQVGIDMWNDAKTKSTNANMYTCEGQIRAFSRTLYTKLRFPKSSADDVYPYLFCKKHAFKYVYSPRAVIFYGLPSSPRDFIKQHTRYLHSQEIQSGYYSHELIAASYVIGMKEKAAAFVHQLFKTPGFVSLYALLLLIPKIEVNFEKQSVSDTWEIIASTKK